MGVTKEDYIGSLALCKSQESVKARLGTVVVPVGEYYFMSEESYAVSCSYGSRAKYGRAVAIALDCYPYASRIAVCKRLCIRKSVTEEEYDLSIGMH